MHTLFSKEDITRTTAVFEIFIELHVMLPFIGKYTKLIDIFFEIVVADVVDPPLPTAPPSPLRCMYSDCFHRCNNRQ